MKINTNGERDILVIYTSSIQNNYIFQSTCFFSDFFKLRKVKFVVYRILYVNALCVIAPNARYKADQQMVS